MKNMIGSTTLNNGVAQDNGAKGDNKGTVLTSDFSAGSNPAGKDDDGSASQGKFGEQREALREKMQAQRAQITRQVNPAFTTDSGFPRSQTMRLLLRRPDLVSSLLKMLSVLLMKLIAVLIRVAFSKR